MDLEFFNVPIVLMGVPSGTSAGEVRDAGSTPGSGRSPGGGHGDALQYSCLRIPATEEPGRLQSRGSQRARHD